MRERIIAAAVEAMNQWGLKFTMHDLAKQLGVSKRSLYAQFSSKDALIHAVIDGHLADIRASRRAILSDTTLTFPEKLRLSLFVAPKMSEATSGRAALDIQRFMPWEWERIGHFVDEEWQTIAAMLQEGIEAGEFRPICLPVLQKVIHGGMAEIMESQFLIQNNVSIKEATDAISDVLIHGILPAGKPDSKKNYKP